MLDQIFDSSFNIGIKTLFLLLVLVAMEAVLSADNAIALATLTRTLQNPILEKRALNIGLGLAYILRMLLILSAIWIVQFWQFQLAGAVYLLWLAWKYFTTDRSDDTHYSAPAKSLWQIIPLIALTDLAFSLDSVTTAIAISQELWLIVLGGTIGVIALRFLAGLFIHWLQEFTHLEDAGYVAVVLVGLRLLLRVLSPNLITPEWVMLGLIAAVFIWGFSRRTQTSLYKSLNMQLKEDVTIKSVQKI
ncbi:TerC family protein [Altericista sp. CCNU0014]|uniref:TerC family protein n=1 Tax=Altericista sp. CCNU0014 TaxID=3082949 RepID=UPI003850F40E